MNNLNLPFFWKRLPWCEKAAYLTRTHQARDYSDACSILAKMRPRKRPVVRTPVVARLPYKD